MSALIPLNSSILQIPDGPDSFQIPSPPSSSTGTKVLLEPDFQAGPTDLSPYHPWSTVVLDGVFFVANEFQSPKWWSKADNVFYDMGANAPTQFALADSASGTTFPISTVVTYFLVGYNSEIGKETAPEGGLSGLSHTMVATKDIDITWTPLPEEYDYVRIYRQLADSDTIKFVAEVAVATGTYTDSSADSTLEANASYVFTYRTTIPGPADWIAGHDGRLFLGYYDTANVAYSQAVRIDSVYRVQDFPTDQILQPGEEDGTGGTRAMITLYNSAYIFKRRACFELYGSISDGTHGITKIGSDRGALNDRCIIPFESSALVLDEKGLYWWSPSGEAIVAGALQDTRESPLQPIWDRMNLQAFRYFHIQHDRRERIIRVFVALDHEPVPNVAVVFDYAVNRFVGLDTLVHSMATGELRDASGSYHVVRMCDMSYLWEDEYAQTQGVTAGDNTATLTSATILTLTDTGASFTTTDLTGAPGVPYERYDTDGTVLDSNRVAAATSTTLTPFYFSTDTPAATQSVAIGVIPAVARCPRTPLGTADKKWVRGMVIEHDTAASGTLRVESAPNDAAYALSREVDITSGISTPCKVSDRGRTWSWQVSQRYANLGFAVRGVHVDYVAVPGQRQ